MEQPVVCTNNNPTDVVGTDALVFTQFSGAGTYSASLGVKLVGSDFRLDFDTNPGLTLNGNHVHVLNDGTRGVGLDASGVFVKIDGTSITFNGSGQLNVPNAGSAQSTQLFNVVASGAVALADPVYWGANDKVSKSLSNNDAKSRVIGIALRAAVDGADTDVCALGAAVGVLSGATVNTPYYLQTTGGIGTSLPGASNRVIQVGKAKNATDLWVDIVDYGKKAA